MTHNSALGNLLREWVRENPWERAHPGEGLVTTDDDPWVCYSCYATQPYVLDMNAAEWWDNTPHMNSGEHRDDCLWKRSMEALDAD
jgi:hypothetical protein